ncbi:hypothetical protein RRF57_013295 [Xylaria bambusicola]|uniref:Uncharacterized protein n=1 Tax=Xylaria bambusicola TaxID=326684 RepID=A0AAN7Z574_9PEZI
MTRGSGLAEPGKEASHNASAAKERMHLPGWKQRSTRKFRQAARMGTKDQETRKMELSNILDVWRSFRLFNHIMDQSSEKGSIEISEGTFLTRRWATALHVRLAMFTMAARHRNGLLARQGILR